MLSSIHIRDLVIVRALDLRLQPGMTALTGETGAGKSILIDALGLALGDKADNGMIRSGCDKAEVSATFDLADSPNAAAWLEQHDLSANGDCIVRRVLVRDGRSRAYINGSPSPQGLLAELGEQLVDIHGQHAHQSLLRSAAQRSLLDAYAGHDALVHATADAFRGWRDARQQHEQLTQAAADRANRLDYLRYQVDELTHVASDASDLTELEASHGRLANAERLLGESTQLVGMLGEDDQSLDTALSQAIHLLDGLIQLDPELQRVRDMLDSAAIQIDEAAGELRHYRDRIEPDPERLNELDTRLGRLYDTARKHRVSPAELPQVLTAMQDELEGLEQADDTLRRLDGEVARLDAVYAGHAEHLSGARQAAATRLATTVTASMQELGMRGGRLLIDCATQTGQHAAHGQDQITFLVAANPGQPPAALAQVASGGELSRISLAIQVATADCGEVASLIFDEVDVGIGGAVAEIVGQLLRRLGTTRQVLCVTHLAQVAAQAHQHLRVLKLSDDETTETRIEMLNADDRIHEVARMMGGIDITEHTLRHAQEMIDRVR